MGRARACSFLTAIAGLMVPLPAGSGPTCEGWDLAKQHDKYQEACES